MTPLLVALAAVVVVLLWLPPRPPAWTPPSGHGGRPWADRTWVGSSRRGRGHQTGSPQAVVPEALELLALALLGGGALAEAARTVSRVLAEGDGAGLARVASALHHGQDTDQAWAAAGPGWEPARRSLELARVAGVAPGPALRQTAADLRAAQITDVEVGTARLGVRLVLPLGLAFLPAFVLTTVLPLVLALTRDLSW
ncbi:secretion system protein [Ornithinimicrobium sufpigmenti]|uniref:secretion system protein n=1 Tax=Ornithinimicrobium sufpigmenti TaxID=2508882 RepID=UPI001035DB45|nr:MULTISPECIES: secretion system protein [unclassified Ornithinimicrobium]